MYYKYSFNFNVIMYKLIIFLINITLLYAQRIEISMPKVGFRTRNETQLTKNNLTDGSENVSSKTKKFYINKKFQESFKTTTLASLLTSESLPRTSGFQTTNNKQKGLYICKFKIIIIQIVFYMY